MADANAPHNAAAPEILAALKALQADLAAARTQLAALERQVGAARAAPVARTAGVAQGAARTEADMARLLQMEREFIGLRQAENGAAKTLADTERARGAAVARNLAEEKAASAELQRRTALQERLNIVSAQASRLPVAQRAGFIGAQARPEAGVLPLVQPQQVRRAVGAAYGADDAARIAATRQSVAALAATEGQYIERTRAASAMSHDFLMRLGSGQATLGEFGRNLAETGGKFAGWTAAAAGVGGLVATVAAMGRGARDSSAGVNQLARSVDDVNPAKAQRGFRDLSREMNVSIKEASDAQFQFSRTFNNSDDSLKAASVGLRALKLDNVSLAESVRALTAIHNQFGVSADDLLPTFDKLDEGQRAFNARVGESLPALTRSTAAVKNAGGNLDDLIKIIVYGVRVSGQTGSVIGNALARSAANFVPKNAKDIRAMGLDPTQGYTELLTEAIHKAATMTGEQRRKLAAAIGGPQLGSRVFAPLLGASKQFDEVSEGLDKKAKGASQFELDYKLAQTDEQLKKVGNTLERIGAALAESGAFAGLGAALKLINLVLGGIEKMINLYDEIPEAIRPWITMLIEARGLMLILQRTRLGEGIANATGVGFLGPSPQRQALRAQTGALGRSAEAYEASATQSAATARAAEQEALIQQRLASEQRALGLYAESNALEQGAVASRQRAVIEGQKAVALAGEADAQRAQILALTRGEVEVSAEIVAAQRAAIAGLAAGNAGNAAAAAAAGTGAAAAGAGGLAAVGQGRALTAAETAAVAAAGSATTTAGRVAQGARQVGSLGARFARGIGRFASGMGLFSKGLITFIVAQAFFDNLKEGTKKLEEQRTSLDKGVSSLAELHAQVEKASHPVDVGFAGGVVDTITHPFGGGVQDTNNDAARSRKKLLENIEALRIRTKGTDVEVGFSFKELIAEEAKNAEEFAKGHISRAEYKRRYDDVQENLKRSLEILTGDGKGLQKAEKDAQRAYNRGFANARPQQGDPFSQFSHVGLQENVDLLESIGLKDKVRGTSRQDFTTITRGITFIAAKYRNTNDKKQLQLIDQAYNALDTFISQQADEFKDILNHVKRSGSEIPASAITPGVALSQLGVQTYRTHASYDAYIKKLQGERDEIPKRLGEMRQGLTRDRKALANAERKLHGPGGLVPGPAGPNVFGSPIGDLTPQVATLFGRSIPGLGNVQPLLVKDQHQIDRVHRLKEKIEKDKKQLAESGKQLSKRDQKILDAINQAQEEQFNIDSQAIDLRAQYAQATAADKSDAIAEKIKYDGQQVQLALRYHGPDRWAKILAALTTQAQDISAQAQQHIADIELSGQLATSRIGGTGPGADRARLRTQLSYAQRALAAARAERPNPNKADDIKNAEIRVNDLNNQIAAQVQQDAQQAHANAEALYQSRIAVRLARAGDDPVRRDRIKLEGDLHALRHLKRSDFKTTAEYQAARNNALATVITDRHQIVTDTANEDLQDAQFQHEIGKLTDEQYISKLKQILKLKGLSKQMRQNLLLEIYRQEHAGDGDLSLNLGDIKLPSTYQIVRGLRKGFGAKAPAVSQAGGALLKTENHNTFTFHINGGNAKEVASVVGETLDTATGGSALANLRAAGAI
jgi:hypothetical protein